MEFFPVGRTYDFMRYQRMFSIVSVLMVVASLVAILVWPGPKMGTDFRGGTEIEVAFNQETRPEEVREAVQRAGFSSPDVIRVQDDANANRYMIRVKEVSSFDEDQQARIASTLCVNNEQCPPKLRPSEIKLSPGGDKISLRYREPPSDAELRGELRQRMSSLQDMVQLRKGDGSIFVQNAREGRVEILLKSKGDQLMDGLRVALGEARVPAEPLRVEWIGPKAGAQLRDAALSSIAIAIVFIMAYIAFRFDLRFAPGAVLALIHDAIVTIGVLVLIERELSLPTVAAILTVVGYSVNDTVVVYDRVRENLGKLRGTSFRTLINISLSETLSRTILTGTTTMLSLTAFLVRGTGTLKDFSLTLLIGLILGTYSSIYVALPLTDFFDRRVFSRFGSAKRNASHSAPTGEQRATA